MQSITIKTNEPDLSATAPAVETTRPGASEARTRRRPGLVRIFPRAVDAGCEVFEITSKAEVGRHPSQHVCIRDLSVSREHAIVSPHAAGFWVSDRGSTQGTYVDGKRVGSDGTLAAFGQLVRFGGMLYLAQEDSEPYRAAARKLAGSFLGVPWDAIAGPSLGRAWEQASRVAALDHPVLILGESGSGKECIARIIHAARPKPGPFVAINIAAVPESLFESELFGYERGAFTGAAGSRAGSFREASGGVLFLDEVAELKPELQVKLLRAIDQQKVRPLGGNSDVEVRVRIVSATSRDLKAMCAEERFRLDLYYRLSGVVIEVPPLRTRRDEVLLLSQMILASEKHALALSPEAAESLALGAWEGNVRNLRHAITHALAQALAEGASAIRPQYLPDLKPVLPANRAMSAGPMTEATIRQAMIDAGGVAGKAAAILGVSRATLYNTCKRLNITPSALREP